MTITITCYRRTKTVEDVQEAIQFYAEGILNSEGAEQARYISIVAQLQQGLTEVVDTNPEYNPYYD